MNEHLVKPRSKMPAGPVGARWVPVSVPETVVAPAQRPRRVSVVNCGIDALTFGETLAEVERLIQARCPAQHCVVNASKTVLMDKDPRLREIVSSCALVNADGQSLVWASRILRRPVPERVTGIDLFQALLGLAADRGYGVYFLGATSEIVEEAVARAGCEHPALRICGWHDGYWDADDDDELVAHVRASHPDILFVALPSPRKEYWLAEHLEKLDVPFSMGVGGSFDVYAGRVKRAPLWMQHAGLEWSYRFWQEPLRLWKRYLLGNLEFVFVVGKHRRPGTAGVAAGGDHPPDGSVAP